MPQGVWLYVTTLCMLEIVRCVIWMCSFRLRGRELDDEVAVQVISKVVPEELVLYICLFLSVSKDSTWLSSQVTFTFDSDTVSIVIDSKLHISNGTWQRSVCCMAWGPRLTDDNAVKAC
jgi:hypothetical protein